MNAERKEAQDIIIAFLTDFDKSKMNAEHYTKIFNKMSDKEFHELAEKVVSEEIVIPVHVPHFKEQGITVDNNIALGEKYGIPLKERVLTTGADVPDHIGPYEFVLMDLPIRRQSQNLTKKISVPDDNRSIDYSTYQPTGDSKGSSLSHPELSVVLDGLGLKNTTEELIRFRGGDIGGFRAYNASAAQIGSINLSSLYPYTTGVESTKYVKSLMLGMLLVLED